MKHLKSISCEDIPTDTESESQEETSRVYTLESREIQTSNMRFKIVGVVTEIIQENVLSTIYSVEDATGSIACFVYKLNNCQRQNIELNKYYRFFGKMRWLKQERGVPASHVHMDVECAEKITDMNEITFHFLDSIHQHLLRKKAVTNKMILE